MWRKELLSKFLNVFPCITLLELLNNILSNRVFAVYIREEKGKTKILNNGLLQSSVLVPLFFNLYNIDLLTTTAKKIIYADDLVLAYQSKDFENLENTLSEDLDILHKFYNQWKLKHNPSKRKSLFHLKYRKTNKKIQGQFEKQLVKKNPILSTWM